MKRDAALFQSIYLVLTHRWFDETTKAMSPKRIEYRKLTPRWRKLIYDRRHTLKLVTFSRGYTKTRATFDIVKIDLGPCLIPGWTDPEYIRIHFFHWTDPQT